MLRSLAHIVLLVRQYGSTDVDHEHCVAVLEAYVKASHVPPLPGSEQPRRGATSDAGFTVCLNFHGTVIYTLTF